MKSINKNQTQLRTLLFGLLCVLAGVMCFAQSFSHGSVSPAVSKSTGERLGDRASSVDVRDAGTPQFASITPRYVTKRIADIEIGEDVVSRDPQSGEVTTKRVANVFRRVSDHLRILKVRNPETNGLQIIETTNEHPFWVTARGDWIKAKDLSIGDHLDDVDGGQAILESTEYESQSNGIPVFNFEVEDFHNYYVRAHGSRGPPILVHNADGYDILQTQILNATPPGINGHPGTGVFGDGVTANPFDVNFTQPGVNKNVEKYVADMRSGDWDWQRSGPIRVMEIDGKLVSYDNRRLFAAREAGLTQMPIEIVQSHGFDPASSTGRTWGQQFERRRLDVQNFVNGNPLPRTGRAKSPIINPQFPRSIVDFDAR